MYPRERRTLWTSEVNSWTVSTDISCIWKLLAFGSVMMSAKTMVDFCETDFCETEAFRMNVVSCVSIGTGVHLVLQNVQGGSLFCEHSVNNLSNLKCVWLTSQGKAWQNHRGNQLVFSARLAGVQCTGSLGPTNSVFGRGRGRGRAAPCSLLLPHPFSVIKMHLYSYPILKNISN